MNIDKRLKNFHSYTHQSSKCLVISRQCLVISRQCLVISRQCGLGYLPLEASMSLSPLQKAAKQYS